MDKREEKFLYDLVALRMEEHYRRFHEDAPTEERKQEIEYICQQEEKYTRLLEELPEEQRRILMDYTDAINNEQTRENDFYYKCGFSDGVAVMRKLVLREER